MKKGLKITAVFCLFLILSVVTLSPVANAQNMDKIRAKEKYAHNVVKYTEKFIIPRYEMFVLQYVDKDEIAKMTDDIKAEFLSLSNGEITKDLEVIMFLISLIIAFFYILFGSNAYAFLGCMITTLVVMIIPITIASFGLAMVEAGIFGLTGVLALFDAETIDDLLHMFGVVGTAFMLIILAPILLLVYLLAIPVITVTNMVLFIQFIIDYIFDNYPLP